jgi:hypothetical protein
MDTKYEYFQKQINSLHQVKNVFIKHSEFPNASFYIKHIDIVIKDVQSFIDRNKQQLS